MPTIVSMTGVDSELYEAVAGRAKQALRQRMKSLRAAYPAGARAARSARIVERLLGLEAFESARSIATFHPMVALQEVDLSFVDVSARAQGKRVYYPALRKHADGTLHSELRLSASAAELVVRGSRFAEPPPEAPLAVRGEVDLVLVPALAVATTGHRLGYGRGFYDSLLPDVRPPALAVVVAFDFQLLAELPVLPHDVACDLVVTDARVLSIGPGTPPT
jgi:5-formyltetrahydrofolate cyclo-ligase